MFTSANRPLGGGPPPTATSTPFLPTAPGTYLWIASYSGDANYTPASTACGDLNESVTITQATPSIATTAVSGTNVGQPVTDTATVSGVTGGPAPTGTVTFTLFGPGDPTCTGTPVFSSANRPLGGGPPPTATSDPFVPTQAGTYLWIASYSGDANYTPLTSACGDPGESSVVSRVTPILTTEASPSTLVGGPVSDTANLAGGFNPTGSITFELFGPDDAACAGPVVFTSTVPVSGNGPYASGIFTPTAPGTYRWEAEYSGDVANNPASSPCNAPNESVLVQPFAPPPCTRTLTGDVVGPVIVGAGESVCISNARVTGPITVDAGGALTVAGSQITNGIVADAPAFFSLCGSQIAAPRGDPAQGVVVTNATVPLRIGDPANGCAGNRVAGDVTLTGNTSGLTFGANIVSRNVTVDDNAGLIVIKANNVFATLACSGNSPAPTNAGQPNTAGTKTGQCTAL